MTATVNAQTVSQHYGKNFEDKIIQAFLGEESFAEQIIEVLNPDLFEKKYTAQIAKLLKYYYFKYDSVPTADILEALIQSELQKPSEVIVKKACFDFLEKIKTKPLNGDMEYVKENSLNYFKTQHIRSVLAEDILPKINIANFDEILPLIQKALDKGSDRTIGYEYNEDDELRFREEVEDKVPTMWKFLNDILFGGWGAKRLTTFIGASGAGKSHLLVNAGAGALMAGKTVAHYTLELDEIDVARRYDACLTDIEINDVPKHKKEVLAKLKMKLPSEAKLIIKEYPMRSASIQTIKSHISRLRIKGIVPDIIVIDYGDLLKSVSQSAENRFNLREVWEQMKALAQELKIPVITATQTNRGGYAADVVTADQVSEDFSKIMTSDIIITAARNIEQKAAGIGKMHIAKNRQGRDGHIFAYSIDTAKCKIDMFELTEDVQAKIDEETKTESEKIRDKLLKAVKASDQKKSLQDYEERP